MKRQDAEMTWDDSRMNTNTALKLHSAARGYCMDRIEYWESVYQKLQDEGKARVGSGYSDEALDTFPRYQVLRTILVEIERIDADNLPWFSELSELLIIAGQIAESIFTLSPISEIEAAAIQGERTKFVDAVRGFTPESIATILPLPHRRVLSPSEVASLWDRVKVRWGADGSYFYPLAESTDSSLSAFDESAFNEAFAADRLQNILRSWSLERIYELRESGDENYFMSVDWWEPSYDREGEGYWFSDALDWIMYASHEISITTGGKLTDMVVSKWKDADQHRWAPFKP